MGRRIPAPGRIVLVVQKGTGWVQRPSGDHESIRAKSMDIYDHGDWVEYGSGGNGQEFQAETYRATGLTSAQNDIFCTRQLMSADSPATAPNGGSARAPIRPFGHAS